MLKINSQYSTKFSLFSKPHNYNRMSTDNLQRNPQNYLDLCIEKAEKLYSTKKIPTGL